MITRLEEERFDTSIIDALVLSHHHFDHIGDISALPSHTKVVCGPGTLKAMQPGYPEDESSTWWSKWFVERDFLELPPTEKTEDWDGSIEEFANPKSAARKWRKVACYDHAVDWFGDGSFWIVETPGVREVLHAIHVMTLIRSTTLLQHCVGHISVLARVTSNPDTCWYSAASSPVECD